MVMSYIREQTLFFLRSEEEANHAEELQIDRGHLDLTQGAVDKVNGEVEGFILEMQALLVEMESVFYSWKISS